MDPRVFGVILLVFLLVAAPLVAGAILVAVWYLTRPDDLED